MASAGTKSTFKDLSGGQRTIYSTTRYQDISSLSLTSNAGEYIAPTAGGLFAGINVSTAGILYILGVDDVEAPLYFGLGTTMHAGKAIMRRAGNTAVVQGFVFVS